MTLLDPADIAKARDRIPLSELVGRTVVLKRSGAWLIGRCPFHDDSSPSFGVKGDHWKCFAGCGAGDAVDFVMRSENLDFPAAIERLAGMPSGGQPATRTRPIDVEPPKCDPNRWRKPWGAAVPITGTLAATYIAARGLRYADPEGAVLRFNPGCGRIKPGTENEFERLPALLALLRNVVTGGPTGILRTYLAPDGRDRLRDDGARRVTGLRDGSAIMLSSFDDVTLGLGVAEGVETAIAVLTTGEGWAPIWAMSTCENLGKKLPVLRGVEALTIFADADKPGQEAAARCAARWRAAGREVAISAPPSGDWADDDDEVSE